MKNFIGDRGEYIFTTLISEKTSSGYLFNPIFLGQKWPTSDFYVELFKTSKPMFCFFQIKATSKGYTVKEQKLKINISKNNLEKLSKLPAPSYVIGINEITKKGYIISVNGDNIKAINNLPTTYPLNKTNLEKLWQEIKQFWNNSNNYDFKNNQFQSNFKV
jgi:hypothetical protein